MGRIVLYARVSTSDQTVDHQREQAEKVGFKIDKVITDNGVSGISTKLSERPQGKRLFDILQSRDTLVVRWIDRLGRDYRDVSDTIRHFMREGVVIKTVINAMVFDGATTDPIQQAVRDALIAFMAAMAKRRQSPRKRLREPELRRRRQRAAHTEDASRASIGNSWKSSAACWRLARELPPFRRRRD